MGNSAVCSLQALRAPVTAHSHSAQASFPSLSPFPTPILVLPSWNCLPNHLLALYPYLFLGEFNPRHIHQLSAQSFQLSASTPAEQVPPGPRWQPVIVQGRLAAEIKEASSFRENIGSNSMSFQKSSQVQHFLSSAITASFYVALNTPASSYLHSGLKYYWYITSKYIATNSQASGCPDAYLWESPILWLSVSSKTQPQCAVQNGASFWLFPSPDPPGEATWNFYQEEKNSRAEVHC